jgi:hypothetical protein
MAKTKLQNLPISSLRLDGGTQARVGVDQDTVETYADVLEKEAGEWPFGPIDVFFDGDHYFVADGFHRTMAGEKVKRSTVPCRIHEGTAKDARIFSMTANDTHGLRMNREDKRACVEWLLDNVGKLPQQQLVDTSGASLRTVQRIVADRRPKPPKPPKAGSSSSGSGTTSSVSSETVHAEDTPAERKRKLKSIIQQHLDKAARAIGELHDQFPNRPQHNSAVKAIQGIQLW